VSVIIPYRTDRGWLGEAIESVKNQDYGGEIELILAKGNHNKSKNLNDGAKLATGQFIKYLDEDDMLTPKSIRNSVDALKDGDALHGNAINLHPSGLRHTHFATVQQPTIDSMLKRNTIHGATLMYRASLFRALGGFDESINTCEEYEFNLRVLKLGIKFVFSPALLAIYRRHDKQKSLGAKANQQRREKVRQSIKNRYV
jgi:glycosyltransferase involved in cell wall biosynthesis